MTSIACYYCGSPRFLAGEIVANPRGGFDVLMPCAECKKPNNVFHDEDPEFAQVLLDFFGERSTSE